MLTCELAQDRLAEEGREVLRSDPELRRHVECCADCTAVLADLEAIDAALESLPHEDAPDELVRATLNAVEGAAAHDHGPRLGFGRRELIAGALAASVVVVASTSLLRAISRTSTPGSGAVVASELTKAWMPSAPE